MKALRSFISKFKAAKTPPKPKRTTRVGENNPNWKGGVRKLGAYYFVQQKHPKAVLYGKTPYVLRATVTLEKKIGRKLKPLERPHHKNENKTDDRPSNLEVQTRLQHIRTHHAGKSNAERVRIRRLNEKLPDKGGASESG